MKNRIKSCGIILGALFLCVGLLCLVFYLMGNPNNYSVEQHISIIDKKVEQKYISDESDYTGFEVYPLYNENEDVEFYLVEYEPYGYIFIYPDKGFFGSVNYRIMQFIEGSEWSPYKVDSTNSQPEPDTDKIWILDDNGEKITYSKSPYDVSGVKDEALYLLNNYVPAVKMDGGFINLISQEQIVLENGNFVEQVAGLEIYMPPVNPRFRL